MLIAPAILIGCSVGILAYWVFSLRLPDAGETDPRRGSLPPHLRILFAYARWLGRSALDLLKGFAPRIALQCEQAADRLSLQADRPGEASGTEVIGLTILAPILTAAFLCFYCGTVLPNALGPALLIGVPLSATLPVLYFRERRAERLQRLRQSFPMALDLLTLCVEAGMDFTEGMKLLANRCSGRPSAVARRRPDYHVCKLFGELLQDIQMGLPRVEALRRMERKTGLPEIGSFATTLSLADETGGSIAENLRTLATEMRNTRVMRAEEHIAKAPVKLAFPIALFLFPVVFLIILGPIGISIAESLRF